MTCFEYSITDYGYLEFPNFHVYNPKIKGREDIIKFLKNTDFKTYYPKISEKQLVVKEYETIYTLIK